MAKKQTELPGTRRDDEPTPQEPIAALDKLCAELDRRKGGAINAAQKVVETKQNIQAALRENKLTSYLYEDSKGVEREVYLNEAIRTRKVKTEDGGDDE